MSAKDTTTNETATNEPAKKTARRPLATKAAPAKKQAVTPAPAKKAAAPAVSETDENKAIREWATTNGFTVGKGRIPAKIKEAYKAAQAAASAKQPPSVDEIKKRMEAKAAEKTEESEKTPAKRVLVGKVVDGADADTVATVMENPEVAKIYNEAKPLLAEYIQVDGRATELLRQISHKLMDLRSLFKDSQGRVDWNGTSPQYLALAASLLREAGVPSDSQSGTRRAIGHHVEDRKRERVPQEQWAEFGVEALTRGQRAGLEKKQAKALLEVDAEAKASKGGKASGNQMLTLARKIGEGISAYQESQLTTLTPEQRNMFRESLEETRAKAEELLSKLQEMEGTDPTA